MSHDEFTGVGIAAELAGEEGAVVVVGILLHVHGVPPQAGQHLSQVLSVCIVLVHPRRRGRFRLIRLLLYLLKLHNLFLFYCRTINENGGEGVRMYKR